MKVTGETMIFKNQNGSYSTTVSNKKEDGTYENMYITVNFRKGVEVENKTKINITDSFISFYKDRNGLSKLKIVVMSFETAEQNSEFTPTNEFAPIQDDEPLPF